MKNIISTLIFGGALSLGIAVNANGQNYSRLELDSIAKTNHDKVYSRLELDSIAKTFQYYMGYDNFEKKYEKFISEDIFKKYPIELLNLEKADTRNSMKIFIKIFYQCTKPMQ